MKIHNPDTLYPASPLYCHGIEVATPDRLLFISGTMGLRPDETAPDGLEQQLEQLWSNVREILNSAEMDVGNLVKVTTFLRDARYQEANAKARVAVLGDHKVATTVVVAETLESDWLVEMDAIAVA